MSTKLNKLKVPTQRQKLNALVSRLTDFDFYLTNQHIKLRQTIQNLRESLLKSPSELTQTQWWLAVAHKVDAAIGDNPNLRDKWVEIVNAPISHKRMGAALSVVGAIDLYDVEWAEKTDADGSVSWFGFFGTVVPAKADYSVGFDQSMKQKLFEEERRMRPINYVQLKKAALFRKALYLYGTNDLVYKVMNTMDVTILENRGFLSSTDAATASKYVPMLAAPPLPTGLRKQRTRKTANGTEVLESVFSSGDPVLERTNNKI